MEANTARRGLTFPNSNANAPRWQRRDNLTLAGAGRSRQTTHWARRFALEKSGMAGFLILAVLAFLAVAAPWVAPYDPITIDPRAMLAGSSPAHPLGTDNLGRDLLSRLIWGGRWSLGIALVAGLLIAGIGTLVGIVSGFVGGRLDDVLMRIVDVLLAFPSLVLALAIVGTIGPGTVNVMLGMAAVWWADYARVVRAATLRARADTYVEAAHCCGCPPWRVLTRHVFPNVLPSAIVLATFGFGGLILALSGLGFLGLGAQPPIPEWGTMLDDGRPFFQRAPQLMLYPGLAIALSALGCNLVGDALRDMLDPRLRR
jgi:ABC-type dipeptide/oligopeptide/nickel transport system permease subunit